MNSFVIKISTPLASFSCFVPPTTKISYNHRRRVPSATRFMVHQLFFYRHITFDYLCCYRITKIRNMKMSFLMTCQIPTKTPLPKRNCGESLFYFPCCWINNMENLYPHLLPVHPHWDAWLNLNQGVHHQEALLYQSFNQWTTCFYLSLIVSQNKK